MQACMGIYMSEYFSQKHLCALVKNSCMHNYALKCLNACISMHILHHCDYTGTQFYSDGIGLNPVGITLVLNMSIFYFMKNIQ